MAQETGLIMFQLQVFKDSGRYNNKMNIKTTKIFHIYPKRIDSVKIQIKNKIRWYNGSKICHDEYLVCQSKVKQGYTNIRSLTMFLSLFRKPTIQVVIPIYNLLYQKIIFSHFLSILCTFRKGNKISCFLEIQAILTLQLFYFAKLFAHM